MRRPGMNRRGLVTAAAVLAVVPLAGGCAAGFAAQTLHERPVIDGVDTVVGKIHLDAVAVRPPTGGVYPPGSTVDVYAVLINTGATTDTLLSVSSPVAASAEIVPGPRVSATATPGVKPRATPTAPAPSSVPIVVLGGQLVRLFPGKTHIVLHGLTETRMPGQFIPVTFTFARAGSVQVRVPVQLTSAASFPPYLPTTSPTPSPSPSP